MEGRRLSIGLKAILGIFAVALALSPSLAIGQIVYSTGTQGCCDLLDPHYTLVAAPQGVTLGNVYSTPLCACWVTVFVRFLVDRSPWHLR